MTVLRATLTCPHCGHEKSETMPTNACVHFYQCTGAARFFGPSLGLLRLLLLWVEPMPARQTEGRDYAGDAVVYCRARMKLSLVRLVATLLLSGQMLPVGLPLLCDQVQRGTPASCEQQMASHRSGRPSVR